MLQSLGHICAFSRVEIHLYDPKSSSTGLNPGSESICFSPLRLSDGLSGSIGTGFRKYFIRAGSQPASG